MEVNTTAIMIASAAASAVQAIDAIQSGQAQAKQPLPVDQAIQQIALQANTYFDPMLADQFARVATECRASLPAMAIATTPSGVSGL